MNKYEIAFNDNNNGKGIPRIWTTEADTAEQARRQVYDKYPNAYIARLQLIEE